MPAALGNAVHNSVEDLCNLDLSGREDGESDWLPATAKAVLDRHWKIERKTTSSKPLGIHAGRANKSPRLTMDSSEP